MTKPQYQVRICLSYKPTAFIKKWNGKRGSIAPLLKRLTFDLKVWRADDGVRGAKHKNKVPMEDVPDSLAELKEEFDKEYAG